MPLAAVTVGFFFDRNHAARGKTGNARDALQKHQRLERPAGVFLGGRFTGDPVAKRLGGDVQAGPQPVVVVRALRVARVQPARLRQADAADEPLLHMVLDQRLVDLGHLGRQRRLALRNGANSRWRLHEDFASACDGQILHIVARQPAPRVQQPPGSSARRKVHQTSLRAGPDATLWGANANGQLAEGQRGFAVGERRQFRN